jgi:hypothetical protein
VIIEDVSLTKGERDEPLTLTLRMVTYFRGTS